MDAIERAAGQTENPGYFALSVDNGVVESV